MKERPRALQQLLRQSVPLISSARDDLFLHSAELHLALRELLGKKDVHPAAAQTLALIGGREDVRGILRAEGPTALATRNGLYPVLTALVLPQSEDEWSVLWRAACNEFKSAWAERGAIQTLRLTASPRARLVLTSAAQENRAAAPQIERAIEAIDADPRPMTGSNLAELGERVGRALQIGEWDKKVRIVYNPDGGRAIIDCLFVAPEDYLTYTAIFARAADRWSLTCVRETLKAFRPPAAVVVNRINPPRRCYP